MASIDLSTLPRTKAKTKSEVNLTASKTPIGLENDLRRFLRFMIRESRKRFENKVLKKMNQTTVSKFQDAQIGNFGDIFDNLSSDFEKSILKQFTNQRIEKYIKRLYKSTNKLNRKVFESSVHNKTGIDLEKVIATDGLDEFTNASIKQSVSQLTNVRDEVVASTKQNVFRLMQQGASMSELYKQVQITTQKNLKRGDLNARNELKNFNSELARRRALNAGITRGIWQTSEDERVRECHKERNGKEYDLSKGLYSSCDGKTLQPGTSEVNCRCIFIPVVDLD